MEEDVSTEYKESLRDLQFNSKPLINMLTMLAEENIEQAPRIVRTIEEHLQKVPIEMKLPVLYLIDSIMKNVGGAYCALFTQNVVSNFCNVFEKGDEKTRLQLFKLRQTWTELFPNKKLYGLDQRVKSMDPAWPILAKPPQQQPAIHINPKFLESKAPMEQNAVDSPKLPSVNLLLPRASSEAPPKAAAPNEGEQIQRLLLQKQQEFFALKQQKMQLEMHLQQQQQMKQKQEAEQLLKSLQQQQKTSATPAEPGMGAPTARLQHPQPAMRDPRLQRATVTTDSLPPNQCPTPNSSSTEPEAPAESKNKMTNNSTASSPNKKFRIPKVSEKSKKGSENDPLKSSKTSPNKSRKSDDRDDRHRSSSSSGKSSISSSSPGRNKKRRGKGGRSAEAPEKEPMGDVDMRVLLSREDHGGGVREEPPQKKVKGSDSISSNNNNPLGDFDYRRPENSARGWAQYKAAHPDEFKSPLRPARENMDGREQHFRPPPGCAPHNGGFRGGMQPTVDRFGRPLFRRLMSDPRFRSHVIGRGERHQLEQMLANPEAFLEQTEEQLRLGRLDPEQHRRIMADLEKLSQFRRSMPRNMRGDWSGGPLGNFASDSRNAPWNSPYPVLGIQEGAPDLPPPPEPPGRRIAQPDVAAMDVDLRKLPGSPFSESGQVGSPDRRPPPQEMSGWVRYGSAGEERPANWSVAQQQQQQQPQVPQDAGMHPRWPPNEWNSFGNGRGIRGGGMGSRPNFGKEYPPYFREDFPHRQQMGGEVMRPNFPARPQLDGVPPIVPPPMPPRMLGPPLGPPPMQRGPPPMVVGAQQFAQPPAELPPSNAPPMSGAPAGLEVNVDDLFAKLVAVGILKANPKKEDSPAPQESAMKKELEKIPPLSFQKVDMLKIKHPGVISALHVGTQCASCGLRFTDEKSEKYSQHLDWHFRTNRRDKDGARKAFSRKWFYEVEDWIQFEEIEDLEERARSFFEQQASVEQDQNSNSPVEIKSVQATGDETSCAVCEEAFQLFWVEEEEEWHFRDAVRVDEKIYHPACYEDFKRALEAPPSPPPSPPPPPPAEEVVKEEKKEEEEKEEEEEEKPMDVVEGGTLIKEEPPDTAEPDEVPAPESAATDPTDPETVCDEPLAIKTEKVGDEMPDDPVVIIDNLGEFGVSEGEGQDEMPVDEAPSEPKVVVKGSGGIVLKVKAESIQAPVSPAAPSPAPPMEEEAQPKEEVEQEEEEFRPPTPDPRFTVLPPVQRGNELSGLCSIM
ncbi:pre-mRNA cleavage complex 2 protein Pcf11-like isoform X2 [Ornithodoros turicata]|uniref:pre-mRNA cleavage complex 2 protein Pcf11-like isoform X2 n=1 Tax=Ornithodoros turicata TaxID=34597 RepID=UPI003139E2CD